MLVHGRNIPPEEGVLASGIWLREVIEGAVAGAEGMSGGVRDGGVDFSDSEEVVFVV